MSSITTSDLENGIMNTLQTNYSTNITFIIPGKGPLNQAPFNKLNNINSRIQARISDDNDFIIISTDDFDKPIKMPLSGINHVFSCSGGNDPFYTNGLLSKQFQITTGPQHTYENPQHVPISNYGIAVILKLKDSADYKELLNSHVCNIHFAYTNKSKIKQTWDMFRDGNLINQDKYRMFIQPGCDGHIFGRPNSHCYIYLGIQLKDDEWDIYSDSSLNIELYIIHLIIFACQMYKMQDYFDFQFDASKFNNNSNLASSDLSALSKNLQDNLSFVHNISIFGIKVYGITNSDILIGNNNCSILGDGGIHVNFFSGSGFNFGVKMANVSVDNLHKNIKPSSSNYKNPLHEITNSYIPNHDYSLYSTLSLSNRVSLKYILLKMADRDISNLIGHVESKLAEKNNIYKNYKKIATAELFSVRIDQITNYMKDHNNPYIAIAVYYFIESMSTGPIR
jgi:hypothetical protein